MKRIRVKRPSVGMIIAVIALIAALGGTAVAGGVLTTKKFKNQAVRGPVQYATSTVTLASSPTAQNKVAVICPTGTAVLGGGVKIETPSGGAFINDEYPIAGGYAGTVFNAAGVNKLVTTVAACATVKSILGTPPAS
jgi:hypothetical protein